MALLAPPAARAEVRTAIDVTAFQVSVAPISGGSTPGVSFAGAGGSTSTCEVIFGRPSSDRSVTSSSASAFGQVSSALDGGPDVGGAATLAGDFFGAGGEVHATAWAVGAGADATGQATIGLVNGVSDAMFTLAPGTRMTITAYVSATAWVSGASAGEIADSGLSMTVADASGTGPQFARVTFDAFAMGLFGPWEDDESTVLSLVYENDTDAPITGLFSGYVASYAFAPDPVSAVPEPAAAAMLPAGIALALAVALARRRSRDRARP